MSDLYFEVVLLRPIVFAPWNTKSRSRDHVTLLPGLRMRVELGDMGYFIRRLPETCDQRPLDDYVGFDDVRLLSPLELLAETAE